MIEGTWRFNYLKAHYFPTGSKTALCGIDFKRTDAAVSAIFDSKFKCARCEVKLKEEDGTK